MSNHRNHRSSGSQKPQQVKVTVYNVGFGDCFLLSFIYINNDHRHVLIDCGSTSKNKAHMTKVVDQIVNDCDGGLTAVVATHRHKDHISAFGYADLGEKLKNLQPNLVIQPWTEHPQAEENAITAPGIFTQNAVKHVKSLKEAQRFMELMLSHKRQMMATVADDLERIASLNIYNKKAILKLREMGENAYVYAGSQSGLERLLPGVKVTVLGPPTLEQTRSIRSQTSWDEDEFWQLYAKSADINIANTVTKKGTSFLFPKAKTSPVSKVPSYVHWVIKQLDAVQFHQVNRIVRELDNALNNTSVILLFEIDNKSLLFPGDAQLESWQYVFSKQNWMNRLKDVTLYKVGHHGSTNATPKTLWNHFNNRSNNKLTSLLSTEEGHHSQVPRASLVNALKSETDLKSTEDWGEKLKKEYIIF
jgi:beta-lactamase superfamily II metal-dependent hydrolase